MPSNMDIDYSEETLQETVILNESEGSHLKRVDIVKNSDPDKKTNHMNPFSNTSDKAVPVHMKSQMALARDVIENNDIEYIESMDAYMVKGATTKKYAVELNPNERCNCPAQGRCYHIIAA